MGKKYVVRAPNGFSVSLSISYGNFIFYDGDVVEYEKYKNVIDLFPEFFRELPEKKTVKVEEKKPIKDEKKDEEKAKKKVRKPSKEEQ